MRFFIVVLALMLPLQAEATRANLFDNMMEVCKETVLSDTDITRPLVKSGTKMTDVCECGSMLFVSELSSEQIEELEDMRKFTTEMANRGQKLISDCMKAGFGSRRK